MNKLPSSPFKRNNYYYGKFLTVEDFNTEHSYINGKRTIINRTVFDRGIVCGLNAVYNQTEKKFVLSSGMALDSRGNEIIVNTDVNVDIQKLENAAGESIAYFYIQFKEDLIGETQIITGEKQKNYFQESYDLGFTAVPPSNPSFDSIWLQTSKTSFKPDSTSTITLTRTSPRWINPGDVFTVTISAENPLPGMKAFENIDKSFTILQGIAQDRIIDFSDGNTVKTYVLKANDKICTGILQSGGIIIGSNITLPSQQISDPIDIIVGSVWNKITAAYFEQSINCMDDTRIYLAKIRYKKVESTVTIISVEPLPEPKYVYGNQLLYNLISFEESKCALKTQNFVGATGILYFPVIGPDEEYISDKINPGLGKGPIDVTLAIEDDDKNLHYGNLYKLTGISLNTIMYPDEGSFKIVAKAKDKPCTGISVKWTASISRGKNSYQTFLNISSKALYFNGTDTYIQIPQLPVTDYITAETWIKIDGTKQNSYIFCFNSLASSGLTLYLELYQYDTHDTRMAFGVYYSNSYISLMQTKDSFPVNRWVHVAVTYNNINKKASIFWDGVSVQLDSILPTNNEAVQLSENYFGKISWALSEIYFKGWMTDIRIWNIERSPVEIVNNRHSRLSGKEQGLAAYFPVIEGSGSTLNDLSGNNLTAEIFGNISWTSASASMFLWWKFNEGSGGTAYDSSGNGRNLLNIINSDWLISGKAVYLRTSKCLTSAPETVDYDAVTFSFWLKPDIEQPDNTLWQIYATSNTPQNKSTHILIKDKKVKMEVYGSEPVNPSSSITIGINPIHVAAVYNSIEKTVKYYFNGIKDPNTVILQKALPAAIGNFNLCSWDQDNTRLYKGGISMFRIFCFALKDEEINNIYSNEKDIFEQ